MKKSFVIISLLIISLILSGCQKQKNFACLDGNLVEYKSQCSTQCGNCECETLENQGNCPQDCDSNYYYSHKERCKGYIDTEKQSKATL